MRGVPKGQSMKGARVNGRYVRSQESYEKACRDARAWAKNNPSRVARTKHEHTQRKKEWLRELKDGRPCADCGQIFHYAAMDWDHREGEHKLFSVGEGAQSKGRVALLAEIAKCDLVCANCHRVRTWNRAHGGN